MLYCRWRSVLSVSFHVRPMFYPRQDVCVPLSRLADCISETKVELEKSSLPAPILAHAGDGNFHVCIFVDPKSPEQIAEAKQLSDRITLRALAMDGELVLLLHYIFFSNKVFSLSHRDAEECYVHPASSCHKEWCCVRCRNLHWRAWDRSWQERVPSEGARK